MMKTSLPFTALALGLATVFCAPANAADVSLSGNLDAGFVLGHAKDHNGSGTSFKFADGLVNENHIALKAVETINNDLAVGFNLVSTFHLNNGALEQGIDEDEGEDGQQHATHPLFAHEARLFIRNSYGELALGRFGALGSDQGSYNVVIPNMDPLAGPGFQHGLLKTPVLNNAVALKTATFGGFTGYAQYSFGVDNQDAAKHDENHRHAGVAATYETERATLVASVERMLAGHIAGWDSASSTIVNIGGNLDFEAVKLFAGFQSARHVSTEMNKINLRGGADTIRTGTIGATKTFGADDVAASVFHSRIKTGSNKKETACGGGLRLTHHLSPRTSLYVGGDVARYKEDDGRKLTKARAYTGLSHRF